MKKRDLPGPFFYFPNGGSLPPPLPPANRKLRCRAIDKSMLRIVKTKLGTVEGIPAADPRITAFKSVPFAKPPVGDLRFAPPQPAEPWEGVR